MDLKGTISTVNNTLISHKFEEDPRSFRGILSSISDLHTGAPRNTEGYLSYVAEQFAIKRFKAKLECPELSQKTKRREDAWFDWLSSDSDLKSSPRLFRPNWAKAKILIARILKEFRLGPVSFTNGSEFIPTRGFNSIESKLAKSQWTCTYDNFDLWVDTCYLHRGLKIAMRKRFAKLLATRKINSKKLNRFLWLRYRKYPDFKKRIFSFKLFMVTKMVQGNRFSTVPKNNLVDRPICIEPLANILTQRRIGLGIRSCLIDKIGIDLNFLAFKHQKVISNPKVATIDLKNASDRISIQLVKYLLPSRVFRIIEQARSFMTLGLDDQYYVINKVSSMGNGFTFELMSLIFLALCLTYDPEASVFGDDIIISNIYAKDLIEDLEHSLLIVNMDKTHINDVYRESCGAHYLDGFGYLESYDFRWNTNIGEVITTFNKLNRLSSIYPQFRSLLCKVYGATPAALHAENSRKVTGVWRHTVDPFGSPKLDTFMVPTSFAYRKDGLPLKYSARKRIKAYGEYMQVEVKGASLHLGFEWHDSRGLYSNLNATRHWAKILMYLASGFRVPDTIRGKGAFKSFPVLTLIDGTTIRWSDVVKTAREGKRVSTTVK